MIEEVTVTDAQHHVFDMADGAERTRLEAPTALGDPFTFRQLEHTGMGPGWCRLEIGASDSLTSLPKAWSTAYRPPTLDRPFSLLGYTPLLMAARGRRSAH